MIGRTGYDIAKWMLALILQLWPLILFWVAWVLSDMAWQAFLAGNPHVPFVDAVELHWLSPIAALAGPAVVMAVLIALHRANSGSRTLALVGVGGLAATTILTGWSEFWRLWPYMGDPQYAVAVFQAFNMSDKAAIVVGLMGTYVGFCIATTARPLGSSAHPNLRRGSSDNFGHADWLAMESPSPGFLSPKGGRTLGSSARKRFPGPDLTYGGLVVGEAYRVDQDRAAQRGPFDPAVLV